MTAHTSIPTTNTSPEDSHASLTSAGGQYLEQKRKDCTQACRQALTVRREWRKDGKREKSAVMDTSKPRNGQGNIP